MILILSIAAGGALGAVLRHLLNGLIMALWNGPFPLGILAVNVAGCFAMGLVAGGLSANAPAELRAFLTTGMLGGFTTFSAFAHDAQVLAQTGQSGMALLYVAATVVLSLAGVAAGGALARGFAP
jgi:CrcB protein